MDRLHPGHATDVDVYDAYRPEDPHRALVRVNMVTTLDGHVADADGVSGSFGGDGDSQAFFAMRHLADGILAGAGTVRAEGYGPMRVRAGWGERRRRDGREQPASIVVVTRSVDLDTSAPLFTEAVATTFVLTTTDAPADRVKQVQRAGGVLLQCGTGQVDLRAGLDELRREHGLNHLLVEGGPALNGTLFAADLVDELCVTLAPTVAGGSDERRVVTGLSQRHALQLTQVLTHGGELLLTYRRA